MAWNWYPIIEVAKTMEATESDQIVTVTLNQGKEDIRFIQGFSVGIIFRDFLLFPNMNDRNPFTKNNQVGAMIHQEEGSEPFYWVGINMGD